MRKTEKELKAEALTARLMDYYETFGDPFELNFTEKVTAAIDMYHAMITDGNATAWADSLEEDFQNNLDNYETEEEFDEAYQYDWSCEEIRDLIEDLKAFGK